MSKYFNKKCPRCGLVNYSDAPITSCQSCQTPLLTVGADGAPVNENLEPCDDCRIPISRRAESCPYCGRFFRTMRPQDTARDRNWWVVTILLAISAFAFIAYWTTVFVTLVLDRMR
jgi:hypothetical protein